MRFMPLFLLPVIIGCSPPQASRAQPASTSLAGTSGFAIDRLDPALDAIVSADASLDIIGDRFGLTEGPVWVQDGASGYLLFSDLIANVIYKWTPDGRVRPGPGRPRG
jgi:gluconolactonase